MIELFILMMERVGLTILPTSLLVNVPYFKCVLLSRKKMSSKVQLTLISGLFTIISNFTGVKIAKNQIVPSNSLTYLSGNAPIADTRMLVIGASGLVGGPIIGSTVGLVAGLHRVIQDGGHSFFYVPISLIVGLAAGFLGSRMVEQTVLPSAGFSAIVGARMETIQMIFTFFFGGDLSDGVTLVRFIALPMILLNSVGTFIFVSVLTTTLKQEEQAKAVQTRDVLELAAEALSYFREGLSRNSGKKVTEITEHYMKVSAIGMTNSHQILTHVGVGSDHYIPKLEVITELPWEMLRTGRMTIAHAKEEVSCSDPNCPLQAAIVIPLSSHQQVVGTLKVYFADPAQLTHVEGQLAEGLETISSSQIKLGEAEVQPKLFKEAEIKFLRTQMNLHFFFNAVSTISASMQKDSEKARGLLLQLNKYFRGNLQGVM